MFSHDEYTALHETAGTIERTARARLQLTGADRRGYLHGLLTNDITALEQGRGCYAALLTPQGRMISDMRVSELGDRVLIDLPAATADTVRQRLADFIFAEDVEVQDVTAAMAQIGVYGPGAARLAGALGADADGVAHLSVDANREMTFDGTPLIVIASDDFGVPGFELMVARDRVSALTAALHERGAVPVDRDTLEVTRIEAGRPEFGRDMDEHTIPLEAGIEERAISFTKGCYVGQEVVIRVLHRGGGRVARRLVGLEVTAGAPLAPSERLADADRDVGVVTSAAFSPRLGRAIGLGYVQRDLAEPGRVLTVAGGDGRTATVAALPFAAR